MNAPDHDPDHDMRRPGAAAPDPNEPEAQAIDLTTRPKRKPHNRAERRRAAWYDAHPEEYVQRQTFSTSANVLGALDGDARSEDPANLFRFRSRGDWIRARNTLWPLLPALVRLGVVTWEPSTDPKTKAPSIRYVLMPDAQNRLPDQP